MTEVTPTPHPRLRGMDLQQLTAWIQQNGQPAYRARQIFQWLFEKGAASFDQMTNLSKPLRAWLAENADLGGMQPVDLIGDPGDTRKVVFETDDGEHVESVVMRNEPGPEDDEETAAEDSAVNRVSLCVSSQVGCALACTFCRTGFGGFRRNLRTDEILSQILAARAMLGTDERLANIVFMGMGEPLLNLDAVIPALRLLVSPQALAVSPRRIILSTAGVIPGIQTLADADTGVNLAVSLNATTQNVRDEIMPGCRRWPIDALLDAVRRFPLANRRRITFEYVLLKNRNDSPDDRRRLIRLVHGIPCKVNLILYNPSPELRMEPTAEDRAEAFRDELLAGGVRASLRRSKGRNLQAACGQLAAHFKTKGKTA